VEEAFILGLLNLVCYNFSQLKQVLIRILSLTVVISSIKIPDTLLNMALNQHD
jgi:hypothetical protein